MFLQFLEIPFQYNDLFPKSENIYWILFYYQKTKSAQTSAEQKTKNIWILFNAVDIVCTFKEIGKIELIM